MMKESRAGLTGSLVSSVARVSGTESLGGASIGDVVERRPVKRVGARLTRSMWRFISSGPLAASRSTSVPMANHPSPARSSTAQSPLPRPLSSCNASQRYAPTSPRLPRLCSSSQSHHKVGRMHWADAPNVVFVRDFAYPRLSRRPLRTMTSTANIGDAPAHTYAEYVLSQPLPDPVFPPAIVLSGCENAPPTERRLRPPLPYRIYSHRLRVRAHAKNERARLLSGPLVDVFVGTGDGKRQWSLHRNLLSYHSEYLASELQTNDATKNKPGNRLELADDDPKGFELLVKWLYQGKLEDVADILGADNKYNYAVACHSLYMLCERFDMPQLKNMAIDQYRKGLRQAQLVPDADEINDIYQKAPEGSPFRTLMTRIAARQIMDPDNERDADNYRACFEASPAFAIDLVNAIKSSTGGVLFDDPTSGDECVYHDHEDGPNCHAKGKGKEGDYEFV